MKQSMNAKCCVEEELQDSRQQSVMWSSYRSGMAALCIISPLHNLHRASQFHASNQDFSCSYGDLRWVGPKMRRKGRGVRITAPTIASLQDEKEAPSTGERVDFDGKLPLFAHSVFQRRFLLGTSTGLLIAIGADFLGITSRILSLNPAFFQTIRADILYPIQGYKRCFEASNGFEFIFPKTWVGDQRLLYRSVQRGEKERALDLPSLQQQSKRKSMDPIVAFGPPGSNGELNVSVVVARTVAGFTLEQLGGPKEVGTTILRRFIAPESSNKVAKLLSAEKRSGNGVVYYTLEYTVQGPSFSRHNVAVYATYAGELFSLNAQTAEMSWSKVQDQFRVIAESFKLLP